MNKPLIAFIGALTLGAALPSVAGPNWFVIEQARRAKEEQRTRPAGIRSAGNSCTLVAQLVPLDHGPRAQITPHESRLRQQEQTGTCA